MSNSVIEKLSSDDQLICLKAGDYIIITHVQNDLIKKRSILDENMYDENIYEMDSSEKFQTEKYESLSEVTSGQKNKRNKYRLRPRRPQIPFRIG